MIWLVRQFDKKDENALGALINVYEYMKREHIDKSDRLVSLVPSGRTRGNGHNKLTWLCLGRRKCFFTVRVTKHWHRLPSQGVESSCLEILKIHFVIVLGRRL